MWLHRTQAFLCGRRRLVHLIRQASPATFPHWGRLFNHLIRQASPATFPHRGRLFNHLIRQPAADTFPHRGRLTLQRDCLSAKTSLVQPAQQVVFDKQKSKRVKWKYFTRFDLSIKYENILSALFSFDKKGFEIKCLRHEMRLCHLKCYPMSDNIINNPPYSFYARGREGRRGRRPLQHHTEFNGRKWD